MGPKNHSNSDQGCESHLAPPANDEQDVQGLPLLDSSEQDMNANPGVLCASETVTEETKLESEDDHGDNNDELTKRIEEFIAKVKRDQMAEMLIDIDSLAQRHN
ncbi:hypothetical protein QQP08_009407 [Theobroma cacao]|nr:hypothetical protein QQP08_009407 [Theobroma cacao]